MKLVSYLVILELMVLLFGDLVRGQTGMYGVDFLFPIVRIHTQHNMKFPKVGLYCTVSK